MLPASSTAEAAFIMPVIIFVILAMIRLLFFMYARIKIEADTDMTICTASRIFNMEQQVGADMLPQGFEEQYLKEYPHYDITERKITVDKDRITVCGALENNIADFGLSHLFTGSIGRIVYSGTGDYWNNPRIKRIISVALRTAGREQEGEEQ